MGRNNVYDTQVGGDTIVSTTPAPRAKMGDASSKMVYNPQMQLVFMEALEKCFTKATYLALVVVAGILAYKLMKR